MARDHGKVSHDGDALEADLGFSHFDRGDLAQQRSGMPNEDVGEVEQIVVLERPDLRFDFIEMLQGARPAITGPFRRLSLHRRRVAGRQARRYVGHSSNQGRKNVVATLCSNERTATSRQPIRCPERPLWGRESSALLPVCTGNSRPNMRRSGTTIGMTANAETGRSAINMMVIK